MSQLLGFSHRFFGLEFHWFCIIVFFLLLSIYFALFLDSWDENLDFWFEIFILVLLSFPLSTTLATSKTFVVFSFSLSSLCFLNFPWLSLRPMNCSEMCFFIFLWLEVFLAWYFFYFCYSDVIPLWSENILCMILIVLNLLRFVLWPRIWPICTKCSWKECVLYHWLECCINISLILLTYVAQFFFILADFLSSESLNYQEIAIEIPNWNCGFVSFHFMCLEAVLFGAYIFRIFMSSYWSDLCNICNIPPYPW